MSPERPRSFSTWDWQVGIKRVLLLRAARGQAYKQRVQTLVPALSLKASFRSEWTAHEL